MIMIIMVMNYRVEQGLPPHGDVEGDVQVGLVAARVELHIPRSMFLFSLALYILKKTVKKQNYTSQDKYRFLSWISSFISQTLDILGKAVKYSRYRI